MPPEVLIVGSGPSGVSAAWPLVQSGVNVTLVDPGGYPLAPDDSRPPLAEARTGTAANWRYLLGDDMHALRQTGHLSPKLRRAADEKFLSEYPLMNNVETRDFVHVGTLCRGGLSNVWGAVVSAFDRSELPEIDQQYDDMRVSFERIADRIGISGTDDDDMSDFHGLGFSLQEPVEVHGPVRRLMENYSKMPKKGNRQFHMGLSRNAVLTRQIADRKACDLSNFCMWGCQRKSIYNSSREIDDLLKFSNFSYRPGVLVESLTSELGAYRLSVRLLETERRDEIVASHLVLAAGVVTSTKLVLDLLSRHGEKIRLLTNPAFTFSFLVPNLIGTLLPRKGFAMAQSSFRLSHGASLAGEASGVLYNADGLSASDIMMYMPFSRPGARMITRALQPALVLGVCYLPSEFSDNRLQVERQSTDVKVILEGLNRPEFKPSLRFLRGRLSKMARQLGAFLVPGSVMPFASGGEVHYGGTLPMGQDVDFFGEVKGAPNLFVADGSVLNRLPSKHPTFAIMANADRIGRGLSRRLSG